MIRQTQSDDTQDTTQSRNWALAAGMVMFIAFLLFMLLYRLDTFPEPWFDEGSHLHVSKNFALNGVYADYSSEGNRPFGPAVGVGPTVLLPIALLYTTFGVSIALARVVIVGYALLSLGSLYLLASVMSNRWLGLLTVMIALLSPGVDFFYNARTVLGEVPGLFFMLFALWLWLRNTKPSLLNLFGVGVFFGLACITKNQYALFILPSLLVAWIADLVWYRQRGWRYFVIPGITSGLVFVAWTFVVIVVLGERSGSFAENLSTLRAASAGAFLVFDFQAMQTAVQFITGSPVYGALLLPAGFYGLIISLRRDDDGQRFGIVSIFILLGLALFVTSLGWERYAFAPLVLGAVLVVRLLRDLITSIPPSWQAVRAMLRGERFTAGALMACLVAAWLIVALALPFVHQLNHVVRGGGGDVYTVAGYLNANVPADAVIETWEPELGVLTDHRYHYPPQIVLADSVKAQWFDGPLASESYDFRAENPDYLIDGPFSKYTFLYPQDRLSDYQLIQTIGAFDVYQRTSPG